jgi:tetratricopeptide (TPR) repeat protein
VNLALLLVLRNAKDYPALLHAAERYLYIDPANASVHDMLGVAELETGQPDKALVELDRALSLGHPRPGQVHVVRTRALLALHQRRAAERAGASAVSADAALKTQVDALLMPAPKAAAGVVGARAAEP